MVVVRPIRTMRMHWRKLGAALPALALIASGTALAATQGSPTSSSPSAANAGSGSRIQVPALPVHEQATFLQSAIGAPLPALALPVGMNALPAYGSVEGLGARKVTLDRSGIPSPALAAYVTAQNLLRQADPGCGLDWALVAAIGRVESNHARFGGNALDSQGIARPGIIGIPLDGTNGTARISDTDRGVWDRDTSWDRAVGPMQFIPGTWRAVGQDADGDGVANPQDMNDAATSTGVYLCSGPGDLRNRDALYNAIFRYNHSDSYVNTVMNIAAAYRNGVTELPVSALPAATTSSAGGDNDSGFAPFGGQDQAAAQPDSSQPAPQAAPTMSKPSPTTEAAPPKNAPPTMQAPQPAPLVPAPLSSVTEAAKAAVPTMAVVTLSKASVSLAQVVGGILGTPPAAPADLSKVFKSDHAQTANLCFVKGALLLNIQQYSQVACPANTQ